MQATQNLPHPEVQSNPAVVRFPQAAPDTITQEELALLLSLRGRFEQLRAALEAEEQSLKARLEAGVSVEPGDHVARLEEHFRASVAWKDKAIDLAERLGLNGRAWAQNVLSHTTKTRTISLHVA